MRREIGPVVAGSFYRADPAALRQEIAGMLARARPPSLDGELAGLIVPHAAHMYSGPVAATAYALLEARRIDRVVAIGPSHFERFPGVATLDVEAWRTPLGTLEIETCKAEGCTARIEPFLPEHCLEVQWPFLQIVMEQVAVTPILTGDVDHRALADVLDRLLDGTHLLLVSSDLSHFLDHDSAVAVDRRTADNILALRAEAIGPSDACGRTGVQASLELARRRDWRVELLDLRTSGDTAGDRRRVVGYGAFAFLR